MKKRGFTKRVELARYELLKYIQEGLSITEISKIRHVSRTAIYKTLSSLVKKGLLIRVRKSRYEITDKGYEESGLEKAKEVKMNNPERIAKVTTKLSFDGDIRDLKDFLIKNKDYFIDPPNKEEKRDIPLPIRKLVIERSKGLCELCGDKGDEIDHIIPFCAGGKHCLENLRLLCYPCHKKTFSQFEKIEVKISNNGHRSIKIK